MKETARITYMSMLLASAFVLSWIEYILPSPVPEIPGIKIGLANIIILFAIFNLKKSDAFMILAARLVLNALFFGNMVSLIYSAGGGIISFLSMIILKRISGDEVVSSISGGIFHNIGQLIIAYFILDSAVIFSYTPYLVISGIIAGSFNGFIVKEVIKRLPDNLMISNKKGKSRK